jgi:hypothetical protein
MKKKKKIKFVKRYSVKLRQTSAKRAGVFDMCYKPEGRGLIADEFTAFLNRPQPPRHTMPLKSS